MFLISDTQTPSDRVREIHMSKGTVQKTSYDLGGRRVVIVATDGFGASEAIEEIPEGVHATRPM